MFLRSKKGDDYSLEVPLAHLAVANGANHGVNRFYVKLPVKKNDRAVIIVTQKIKRKKPYVIMGYVSENSSWKISLEQILDFVSLNDPNQQYIKSYIFHNKELSLARQKFIEGFERKIGCVISFHNEKQIVVDLKTAKIDFGTRKKLDVNPILIAGTVWLRLQENHIKGLRLYYRIKDINIDSFPVTTLKEVAKRVYKPLMPLEIYSTGFFNFLKKDI